MMTLGSVVTGNVGGAGADGAVGSVSRVVWPSCCEIVSDPPLIAGGLEAADAVPAGRARAAVPMAPTAPTARSFAPVRPGAAGRSVPVGTGCRCRPRRGGVIRRVLLMSVGLLWAEFCRDVNGSGDGGAVRRPASIAIAGPPPG